MSVLLDRTDPHGGFGMLPLGRVAGFDSVGAAGSMIEIVVSVVISYCGCEIFSSAKVDASCHVGCKDEDAAAALAAVADIDWEDEDCFVCSEANDDDHASFS